MRRAFFVSEARAARGPRARISREVQDATGQSDNSHKDKEDQPGGQVISRPPSTCTCR